MLHVMKKSPAVAFLSLLVANLVGYSTASYATDISPPYFGVSYSGGTNGAGFVYEVTHLTGTGHSDLQVIYNFCSRPNCADGGNPASNILQMPDGSLVGTTSSGGSGAGTIFVLTPSQLGAGIWDETTAFTFCTYWEDCGHFGYPIGGLSLIGPSLIMGSVSNGPSARGELYTYDLSAHTWTAYTNW